MSQRATTNGVQPTGSNLIHDVKAAAEGRWREILAAFGFSDVLLTPKGQPCPKCGGVDRYNAAKDVAQTGAVYCRKCFNKSFAVKPGDGIASVAWMLNIGNGASVKRVADYLGLTARPARPVNVITAVSRDKQMPESSFRQYGVQEATRGRDDMLVARVDVYNATGAVHSYFDLWPGEKGKFKRGDGNSGMFFPGRLPTAGEKWLLVEGVKDAAALTKLGFNAAGLPSSKIPSEFAPLFANTTLSSFTTWTFPV